MKKPPGTLAWVFTLQVYLRRFCFTSSSLKFGMTHVFPRPVRSTDRLPPEARPGVQTSAQPLPAESVHQRVARRVGQSSSPDPEPFPRYPAPAPPDRVRF